MIKAVVFDLWNTLIPATIDFVHLTALAKQEHLTRPQFVEKYERAVQLKKYKNFEQLRADFFKAFRQYDNHLLERELYEVYFNRFDKVYLFPEAEKVLLKLKAEGYLLALLTNTESLYAKEIERRFAFKDKFNVVSYSFETKKLKPDPEAFLGVLRKLKVRPGEALMVGDSLRSDMAGSKGVGMHCCLVDRKGKVFDTADFRPDFKIGSMDELFRVIGTINAQAAGKGLANKK